MAPNKLPVHCLAFTLKYTIQVCVNDGKFYTYKPEILQKQLYELDFLIVLKHK